MPVPPCRGTQDSAPLMDAERADGETGGITVEIVMQLKSLRTVATVTVGL